MKQKIVILVVSSCVASISLWYAPSVRAESAPDVTAALMRDVTALSRTLTLLMSLSGTGNGMPPGYAPLSDDRMADILGAGIHWLEQAQEQNGHFRYEYVPYEDAYLDDDNIVRQAGAFYQLGEIERLDGPGEYDLEQTLARAARYFEGLSADGAYGGSSFRCITEHEESARCKLGATSLALIGLIDFVEEYPSYRRQYESLIDAYATYILAMKKEDAGFRNLFTVGRTAVRDEESSFSNGEALLALVRYEQFSDADGVRDVIDDAFRYLSADEYPFDTALYLWMMAALKDMDARRPHAAYREYAQAFTDWRIDGFMYRRNTAHNMCAYAEGIVSAYILLEDTLDSARAARYRDEIDLWLWKSSLLQLTSDDVRKVITSGGNPALYTLNDPERAIGGFLTGHDTPTERIDFTQHCISAYAQTLAEIRETGVRK